MNKHPLEQGQQTLNLFFNNTTNTTPIVNNQNLNRCQSSTTPKINIYEQEKLPGDLGTENPAQPVIDFPKSNCDNHRRSFQKEWYKQFSWVEYSIERNAVFCFACLHFLPQSFHDSDPAFTSSGFKNWKKALEQGRGLFKHAEC